MATIVTRAGKGSPLTHNEVDANFNNLNSDKLEASNNLSDLDDAAAAVANLGVTASASELNILDGATLSTAELNILDGVTATTAELNILDGVTATTAEINQLDGNSFTADVLPDADSTRDLGSSTKAWAEAHVDTVISTNVSDGTTSVGTTYVTNGSAKAWVNFDGTGTIATRDSFNVTSLTDNGTGDYTVTFTDAMGNANYVCNVNAGGADDAKNLNPPAGIDRTTTTVGIDIEASSTGASVDVEVIDVLIHGDLA
jgi:hypothetical protein